MLRIIVSQKPRCSGIMSVTGADLSILALQLINSAIPPNLGHDARRGYHGIVDVSLMLSYQALAPLARRPDILL